MSCYRLTPSAPPPLADMAFPATHRARSPRPLSRAPVLRRAGEGHRLGAV